jgi:hypothetical protein
MRDPDIPDYELVKTDGLFDEDRVGRSRLWIAGLLLVLVTGGVGYYMYNRRPVPAPAPAKAVEATEEAVRPLGGAAEQVAVPPLDESDGVVRDLVSKISSHPAVAAWLTTNGLIRNFTVVVANVAEGITPAKHLRALRPTSSFRVFQRNGRLVIDPKSYERYDGIAAAVASIDPASATRVYATLKPRIQEAYGQLGLPPDSFDRAIEQAIVSLLQTPVIDGPVRVEPKGIGYRYADPQLEGMTAAQKHLLRTGPRNVRTIQSALRQLAIGLGVPAERLPAARS